MTRAVSIGPYLIEKRLGVGGMAEVFLAKKPLGGAFKRVVVKRMLPHLATDERFVEMFLREAGILAQLNHGNVVQIFDLGASALPDGSDELYIAMEYLEGINVYDLAVRAWRARRALPVELVLRILMDAARGLDYVHRQRAPTGEPLNLVHRDIAPDNLFFSKDGGVKLLDFGVARSPTMKRLTSKGELKGKIPFMAPEALEGLDLDGRADLFSLGVTAFWLLTGKKPFSGKNDLELVRSILRSGPARPSASNPDIPTWIDELVLGMLEKDRANRTQTGADVESFIVKRAGNRLDQASDVAFVDALLAIPESDLEDSTAPIPAIQRVHSDVFARVDTAKLMFKRTPPMPAPTPTSTPSPEVAPLRAQAGPATRSGATAAATRGPRPVSFVDDPSGDVVLRPAVASGLEPEGTHENPFDMGPTTALNPEDAPLLSGSDVESIPSDDRLFDDDEDFEIPIVDAIEPVLSPVPSPVPSPGPSPVPSPVRSPVRSPVPSPVSSPPPPLAPNKKAQNATGPVPRMVSIDTQDEPGGDDDPTSDTVRMTESQLGVRRERE